MQLGTTAAGSPQCAVGSKQSALPTAQLLTGLTGAVEQFYNCTADSVQESCESIVRIGYNCWPHAVEYKAIVIFHVVLF